jgi:hypothetical protein
LVKKELPQGEFSEMELSDDDLFDMPIVRMSEAHYEKECERIFEEGRERGRYEGYVSGGTKKAGELAFYLAKIIEGKYNEKVIPDSIMEQKMWSQLRVVLDFIEEKK